MLSRQFFKSFFKPKKVNKYGWKPDLPDHRDLKYTLAAIETIALPLKVDLRNACPAIYDQKNLGSCTANASGAVCQYEMIQNNLLTYPPSRLFIYYNTRKIGGTTGEDSGASIRDTIKSLATYGYCAEALWVYDVNKFTKKPPGSAYEIATKNKLASINYMRVEQREYDLKACLAQGNLIVFGFTIYESFETQAVAKTGNAPMPGKTERSLGGHAVTLVGFNDETKQFIVRNSWGTAWGQNGYFTLPYAYVLNSGLASDFWCIKTIPGGTK